MRTLNEPALAADAHVHRFFWMSLWQLRTCDVRRAQRVCKAIIVTVSQAVLDYSEVLGAISV